MLWYHERAAALLGLRCVDAVIGFNELDPRRAFGEVGRNGGTMRGDEADLAQRQPQAAGQRQRNGGKKEEGEVGGHEMRCEAMRK